MSLPYLAVSTEPLTISIECTFQEANRQDHLYFLALCAQGVQPWEVCKSSAGALIMCELSGDIGRHSVLNDTVVLTSEEA